MPWSRCPICHSLEQYRLNEEDSLSWKEIFSYKPASILCQNCKDINTEMENLRSEVKKTKDNEHGII